MCPGVRDQVDPEPPALDAVHGQRHPVQRDRTLLRHQAFEAVGCEGLARVDFFVQGDGSLIVNEINTMPGFTPTSMFPQMWAESGLDYPALVDRLLQLALQRGTGLR